MTKGDGQCIGSIQVFRVKIHLQSLLEPERHTIDQGGEFNFTEDGFTKDGYYVEGFKVNGESYNVGDKIECVEDENLVVDVVWKKLDLLVFKTAGQTITTVKNVSALAVAPTVMPKNIVIIFISAFCAVSESLSVTPHSRKRLPSISIPRSGTTEGNNNAQKIRTDTGKIILTVFETPLSCFISTLRSFSVVRSFMIGG